MCWYTLFMHTHAPSAIFWPHTHRIACILCMISIIIWPKRAVHKSQECIEVLWQAPKNNGTTKHKHAVVHRPKNMKHYTVPPHIHSLIPHFGQSLCMFMCNVCFRRVVAYMSFIAMQFNKIAKLLSDENVWQRKWTDKRTANVEVLACYEYIM